MITRYNNTSLALAVPGLVLQVTGCFLLGSQPDTILGLAGAAILLPGTILWIAGLGYYARAKGRCGLWGVWGFFSCFGLIVLALLEDRAPEK